MYLRIYVYPSDLRVWVEPGPSTNQKLVPALAFVGISHARAGRAHTQPARTEGRLKTAPEWYVVPCEVLPSFLLPCVAPPALSAPGLTAAFPPKDVECNPSALHEHLSSSDATTSEWALDPTLPPSLSGFLFRRGGGPERTGCVHSLPVQSMTVELGVPPRAQWPTCLSLS